MPTIEYKYDGFNRRIERYDQTTRLRYLYDENNLLESLNNQLPPQVLQRFTHRLSTDEPVSVDQSSQSYFYLGDAQASIRKLTNLSGTVLQNYSYDAFGNLNPGPITINQPFTYTGREWDAATGLYYYRARYYDPTIGRFLSEDPIGFEEDTNVYTYVGNNPINFTDPSGMSVLALPAVISCGPACWIVGGVIIIGTTPWGQEVIRDFGRWLSRSIPRSLRMGECRFFNYQIFGNTKRCIYQCRSTWGTYFITRLVSLCEPCPDIQRGGGPGGQDWIP